jgi:hypothetical protein
VRIAVELLRARLRERKEQVGFAGPIGEFEEEGVDRLLEGNCIFQVDGIFEVVVIGSLDDGRPDTEKSGDCIQRRVGARNYPPTTVAREEESSVRVEAGRATRGRISAVDMMHGLPVCEGEFQVGGEEEEFVRG